jgi:regulator of replication initiation timing
VLHLTKSQIAEWLAEAWQVAHVAELEEVNAQLCAELDASRSKMVEIECRGQPPTLENEGLKKDLENARTAHDAVVKDKAEVQKTEHTKLQRFQDSIS